MSRLAEHGVPMHPGLKWAIRGGLIACVLLMLLLVKPAWSFIKEWRAESLAEEALILLNDDALENAWEKAQSAYALYPNNAEVSRAVAKVYTQADINKAVDFWIEAYEIAGEREDLENLIKSAIISQRYIIADKYLAIYMQEYPDAAFGYFMQARKLLAQQKLQEAIKASEKSLKGQNMPDDAHFLYVQLTQFSSDEAQRNEGIQHLRELAKRNDELGLKALRNLGNYSQNTPDELAMVIQQIRANPNASRDDLLTALRLEMLMPSSNAEENLEEARELFQMGDPDELVALGRWLNSQNRYAQTLQLIDGDKARTRADLFLVWLDALAVTEQWDVVSKVLDDDSTPIDSYLRLLFQARVYLETGQASRAEFAWSRAILKASRSSQQLWFLTQYARRLGLYKETKDALERLTKIPVSRRKAYEQLAALEQTQGSVESLREILQAMHEDYPKDLIVQNDLAYANLLLNENVKESAVIAQKIIEDGSPYLANRVTLALAYYKLGRAYDAAEVLDAMDIDWTQARSGFRAVYAAILRANGRPTQANRILSNMDFNSLLKEEQQLLLQAES